MSIRVDTSSWITGAIVVGNRGLCILADNVPATGDAGASFLFNDIALPADSGKEVCGRITSWPASGTLTAYEDGSFEFAGAADGNYTFQYSLLVDGVSQGTGTVSLQVGSPVAAFSVTTTDATSAFAGSVKPLAAFSQTTDAAVAAFAGKVSTLGAFNLTTDAATSTFAGSVKPLAATSLTTAAAVAAFAGTVKPIAAFSQTTGALSFAGGAGTVAAGGFNATTADATSTFAGTVKPLAALSINLDSATFAGGAGTVTSASFNLTTDNLAPSLSGEVLLPSAFAFSIATAGAVVSGSASGQVATGITLTQADIDAIAAAVLQALASLNPGVVQVNVTNPDQIAAGVWGFTVQ